jgi:hypothetical protein
MRRDINELARVICLSHSLDDIVEISDINEEAIVRLLIYEGLIDLDDYFRDTDYLMPDEEE